MSPPFTPTVSGTYQWRANYSGDENNTAVGSVCVDPAEAVVVVVTGLITPTLTTTASPSVAVGGSVTDTATLGGGLAPVGSITFDLYGPDDATCSGAPAFTDTASVLGNGQYTSDPFVPTAPGTYRWRASYSGDVAHNPVSTACNDPAESVVVTGPPQGTLTTAASAPVAVGGQVTDTATLAGAANPTGTITFTLYGPDDATCAGAPAFTSTKTVTGNNQYTSDPFTPTAPGTYRWVAVYSGDANNTAITSPCNAPNESVLVTSTPVATLTTQASPAAPVGGQIFDMATLSGATNPTGTITFTLFGPDDATCAGPSAFTSTKPINGNGTFPSDFFTPTAAGTYRWVASYSGDANNASITNPCNSPNESVVVSGQLPLIFTTQASSSVGVGGAIADIANLSGGLNPTGTIAFSLFGPDDATCTGTPAFTSTVPVNGSGSYNSGSHIATAPGTYRWVAVYSGDANNTAVTSPCNAPNESVVVTSTPEASLTTQASPSVPVGGQITDTATLSGATNPTGVLTFLLYGPDNATCSGAAIFTSDVSVTANGQYTSAPFTPTAPGTYRWIATYGFDNNNHPPPTFCNDPNESVVVTQVGPITPTLTTAASQTGPSYTDTATLAGGTNPTGTITFTLFGPNNGTCTGTPAFTSTVTVTGNGQHTSAPFTPAAPGTYRWVAAYSGDVNHAAVSTSCNDPAESFVVGGPPPPVTVVTQASASVAVGGQVTDTATLTGGTNPTGTVTFVLFGPNDATCGARRPSPAPRR